uniref:Testis expressed 9 n=1 Tax=Cyprinus carpio carpio TaxID=630221 RepID=A0A8C1E2S3_CYPCA
MCDVATNPHTKGDDTWGNFFEQCYLATFPLRMGNKFLSGFFRSWALCFTWLPTDGNIAQQHCSKSCPVHHHLNTVNVFNNVFFKRDQNEVLSKPISSNISIDTDLSVLSRLLFKHKTLKKKNNLCKVFNEIPQNLDEFWPLSVRYVWGAPAVSFNFRKAPQTVVDDVAIPEDFGDFSLAKTISIIEDRVSDDLTEELLQDDIMPSAGEEMAQIRFLKAKLRVMRVELNRLEYECNKYECNKKDIEEERARHQRTTNVQQTQVVKQSALAEESSRTCEGLQQQVEAQKVLELLAKYYSEFFPQTTENVTV